MSSEPGSRMSQVTVTIAGHTYRMACGPGEEQHLEGLAALFDVKIAEMRSAFGEIGDLRLHVMAAITLADELMEARRRLDALQQELAQATVAAGPGRPAAVEAHLAETIDRMAERIERLARGLNPAPQPVSGS